jgi:hypothetical protein
MPSDDLFAITHEVLRSVPAGVSGALGVLLVSVLLAWLKWTAEEGQRAAARQVRAAGVGTHALRASDRLDRDQHDVPQRAGGLRCRAARRFLGCGCACGVFGPDWASGRGRRCYPRRARTCP